MNDKFKIIDNSLKNTVKKYYPKIKNSEKLANLYIMLLEQMVKGNFLCINVKDRLKLEALGKDVILLELIKNIVKVNIHYKNEKNYSFRTNKTLNSKDLTVPDIEYIIYREVLKEHTEELMNKLQNNSNLMLGVIISFVDSRYYKKTKIELLDKIEDFNDLKIISNINQLQDKNLV